MLDRDGSFHFEGVDGIMFSLQSTVQRGDANQLQVIDIARFQTCAVNLQMQNEYHMEQSIATKIWGPQLGSFSSSMSKHNIGVAREVRRGVGVCTHTHT